MPRLFVAFPLLALLISWTPAPAAPVPKHLVTKDPVYWPTKVGTKFVYDRDGVDDTVLVTKVEEVKDGTLVTTETVAEDGTMVPEMKVLVSPKGLFRTEEFGAAYEPPWCMFQLPYRPGSTWETTSNWTQRGELSGRRTAGKEERLKTPAGEFTVIRIDWERDSGGVNLASTAWYAAEIGLVRSEVTGRTRVLKSFTPGKD